jgi:hypothetical protein
MITCLKTRTGQVVLRARKKHITSFDKINLKKARRSQTRGISQVEQLTFDATENLPLGRRAQGIFFHKKKGAKRC